MALPSEKPIQCLDIFCLQHPSRLTQLQLAQQHVIPGFGQIAFGLEELAL
ncbi:MAG: hypothetical protein RLZZ329_730, partial [Pseudomonadota bacterium]